MKKDYTNYLVVIDKDSNKILSFEEYGDDVNKVVADMDIKNKDNTNTAIEYKAMLFCQAKPTLGADYDKNHVLICKKASDEAKEEDMEAIDSAIQLLMSFEMTLKVFGKSPLPFCTKEELQRSIKNVISMLFMTKLMNDKINAEKKQNKQVVEDLFKDLGLKFKKED